MICTTHGLLTNPVYFTGSPTCNLYVLDAPVGAIIEGGVTCEGPIYSRRIQALLGRKQPELLFLTHSHWDHCGAVAHLKEVFPTLQIAAPSLTGEIVRKETAQKLIQQLNQGFKERSEKNSAADSVMLSDEPFKPFSVDIILQDGRETALGDGVVIKAFATPGHTREHYSYYLPRVKVLFAGEAAGLYETTGAITVSFVSDYEAYLSNLRRLSSLAVQVLCLGHFLVLIGENEIKDFFEKSWRETIRYHDQIIKLLNEEHGDTDRVIEKLKTGYFGFNDDYTRLELFMINTRAQVLHLAKMKA